MPDDQQGRPAFGDPAARRKRESKVVAKIGRDDGPEGGLGLVESRLAAVKVDVEGVPGRALEPRQEGSCSLENPYLWLDAEHPSKQPIVGELALEVAKLGSGAIAGNVAEPIRDRLAERGGV